MPGSPNHAEAITPSDTVKPHAVTDWLSFTNSGAQTLTITTPAGDKVTVVLPTGMYPIRASQVWNTGTSVTGIVGWWN